MNKPKYQSIQVWTLTRCSLLALFWLPPSLDGSFAVPDHRCSPFLLPSFFFFLLPFCLLLCYQVYSQSLLPVLGRCPLFKRLSSPFYLISHFINLLFEFLPMIKKHELGYLPVTLLLLLRLSWLQYSQPTISFFFQDPKSRKKKLNLNVFFCVNAEGYSLNSKLKNNEEPSYRFVK